jgi:hypothetical protein
VTPALLVVLTVNAVVGIFRIRQDRVVGHNHFRD